MADEALAHAFETFDGPVTVLNVITSVDVATSEGPVLDADADRQEAAEQEAQKRVEKARDSGSNVDKPVRVVVREGDPADVILEYVESQNVDHIVMGSHGGEPGELRRRLLGTVSTAILGEAPIPVTVVR